MRPKGTPPCDQVQTVTQAKAVTLVHVATVSAQQTGRGKEAKTEGTHRRRSQRRRVGSAAGLPPFAFLARRAVFLMARPGRRGGAGRLARRASDPIAVTMSTTGNTSAAVSAPAAAAIACPDAMVPAMAAAEAIQPMAVTAATATSSGTAAGLVSQDTSRRGGGTGISLAGGHGAGAVQPCPSHHTKTPDPAGSGYQPAAGMYRPGGTHPG